MVVRHTSGMQLCLLTSYHVSLPRLLNVLRRQYRPANEPNYDLSGSRKDPEVFLHLPPMMFVLPSWSEGGRGNAQIGAMLML